MTNTKVLPSAWAAGADTPAIHIGSFEPGTKEWHELRSTGIGGSDIGAIAGLSKWQSFYSLWSERTMNVSRETKTNEAMEWGNRLEPAIIQKFADEHPEFDVIAHVGTYAHHERSWQHANPDAVIHGASQGWGILEIKTAQYEDEWTDSPPPHYEAQVQWYLNVMGFDYGYIAVLFHGNRYAEFRIEANPLGQEALVSVGNLFMEYVTSGQAPSFDGSTATLEAVRASHPLIEQGGEIALDEQLELDYWDAKKKLDESEEAFNLVRSRILGAMGTAQRGYIHDNWVFTRTARNGGTPYLAVKKG